MALPFSVSIVVNTQDSIDQLERVTARLASLDEALLLVGEKLSEYMTDTIDTEGHGSWEPLSPVTTEIKAALGYDPAMLVRTGDMRGAVENAEWQAQQQGSGLFIAQLEVPLYSHFHFEGTRFMPARDYGFIGDDFEPVAIDILESWLNG